MFKETNQIKFETEGKEKIPSKMSKKALKSAMKGEGINSGFLKEIKIEGNIVYFYIKKDNKLIPGKFQLARNKIEFNIIKKFLEENKVNSKIVNIIREEGIAHSLKKKLIKIG